MKRRIVISSLVVLLVMVLIGSFGLAMGKKPAVSEQSAVSSEQKAQAEVQPEAKETPEVVEVKTDSTKATEQKVTQVAKTKEAEPKLVMEYKFDEEVVDVIFDEAEMTVKEARTLGVKGLEQRRATETVKAQYPKVVFIARDELEEKPKVKLHHGNFYIPAKSIKFLDKRGSLKKEISVQQYIPGKHRAAGVAMSENKRYIVITTVKEEEWACVLDAESVILNTEGKELWRINHQVDHVNISPNGKYVIGTDPEGGNEPLQIFFSDGSVKEIKRDTGSWEVEFSKDGSFFAVSFETIDWNVSTERYVDRRRKHLILLDDKGNELWRKENITQGRAALYSEVTDITNDDIIIFTVYRPMPGPNPVDKVYYFDKEGNLIKKEVKLKEE